MADNANLQDVTRRLLAAFQEEGCGNNMTVSGNTADVEVVRKKLPQLNILSLRVRQESEDSIILELEFIKEKTDWKLQE